ncbi:MAG: 1,4-alpha-glucan branching protein GlgB [Lachnospiraceae bacterium]
MDFYNFYTGKEFEAYNYLGAHTYWGGTTFRTFAPAAKKISLIGDFSNWEEIPLNKIHDGNFWEISINGPKAGNLYKYRIYGNDGSVIDHADPYGFFSELRPASASIIYDPGTYTFQDYTWMNNRKNLKNGPINIYEMHFGSWKKKTDEDENGFYSYEEMIELLIPYLKENGYNFVELMPLNEYPCDRSWGYQSTGYFSPTSRYGTPVELKKFIDACHKENIAVILDFIPVHFAVDSFGLHNYDGTALFEYPNNAVGYNEWGSCNFMHSRGETCSFLQSAANFWLSEYHFDGLRMDAVGNLIYWQGNPERGENKAALSFLQTMNQGLKERHYDALLFAEDSSSRPLITKPVNEGGLGFDFKWDLGWMHDTLSYFASSPESRSGIYHKLTFSMMYYYNENYILPLSHDEVVHGKATIVQKMSDLYEGKFRQARAFYMYMYAHPGKKLNFMGNEIGQLREWDETRQQDWDILKYPIHDAFHHFMKDLNNCYLDNPALFEWDYNPNGFSWVDCHREADNIYVIKRNSSTQQILAFFNFASTEKEYHFESERPVSLKLLLHSDEKKYGGTTDIKKTVIKCPEYIDLILPAFSAQFFEIAG